MQGPGAEIIARSPGRSATPKRSRARADPPGTAGSSPMPCALPWPDPVDSTSRCPLHFGFQRCRCVVSVCACRMTFRGRAVELPSTVKRVRCQKVHAMTLCDRTSRPGEFRVVCLAGRRRTAERLLVGSGPLADRSRWTRSLGSPFHCAGLRGKRSRHAWLWPRQCFTHAATFQDDVIGADFREADTGRNVIACAHGKHLFRSELQQRVAAMSVGGGNDTEQPDREAGRGGSVGIALRAAKQASGGRRLLCCGRRRRSTRFRTRGKPFPGPVCQYQAEQRDGGECQQRHDSRRHEVRSFK